MTSDYKFDAYCVDCDQDFGCGDCWPASGSFCAECGNFGCYDCDESVATSCDECLELYCDECGDFKPGKNGNKRCFACQPWWQKGKPANAFCRDCGSTRQAADICIECHSRVCHHCCSGLSCELCGDFTCDQCPDEYCPQCTSANDTVVCLDCCDGHSDEDLTKDDDDDDDGDDDSDIEDVTDVMFAKKEKNRIQNIINLT